MLVTSEVSCILATDLFDDTKYATYVFKTPHALKSGRRDNPLDRQN
jgi:hypothetical protein